MRTFSGGEMRQRHREQGRVDEVATAEAQHDQPDHPAQRPVEVEEGEEIRRHGQHAEGGEQHDPTIAPVGQAAGQGETQGQHQGAGQQHQPGLRWRVIEQALHENHLQKGTGGEDHEVQQRDTRDCRERHVPNTAGDPRAGPR